MDLLEGLRAAMAVVSKPGRVVVTFTADRAQLDKLTLWVMVPGSLGGTVYDLRVKNFVELKKDR